MLLAKHQTKANHFIEQSCDSIHLFDGAVAVRLHENLHWAGPAHWNARWLSHASTGSPAQAKSIRKERYIYWSCLCYGPGKGNLDRGFKQDALKLCKLRLWLRLLVWEQLFLVCGRRRANLCRHLLRNILAQWAAKFEKPTRMARDFIILGKMDEYARSSRHLSNFSYAAHDLPDVTHVQFQRALRWLT